MNFFSTKSTLLLGNKYEFEESQKSKLGSGAYANVYKGVDKSNGSAVAIKVIELAGRNARELTYLQQEVEIMRKLRHPNVIQLYHIEVRWSSARSLSSRLLESSAFPASPSLPHSSPCL